MSREMEMTITVPVEIVIKSLYGCISEAYTFTSEAEALRMLTLWAGEPIHSGKDLADYCTNRMPGDLDIAWHEDELELHIPLGLPHG